MKEDEIWYVPDGEEIMGSKRKKKNNFWFYFNGSTISF